MSRKYRRMEARNDLLGRLEINSGKDSVETFQAIGLSAIIREQ